MAKVDISQSPYWDDYNENKKFHKILYRPKRAVQARELNQLQTVLQKQIERMGAHIFEQGAQVLPGSKEGVKYVNNNGWIKIPRTSFADDATQLQTYWMDKIIVSTSSNLNITAKVIGFREPDSIDEARLYLTYLSADDSGLQTEFLPGQNIETVEAVPVSATIAASNSVGKISSVIVEEGVYFFDGNFILVDQQQVFLIPDDPEDQTAWNNEPTALVGLVINESIVTSEDDDSLLDNSIGTPNFSAPGADRLAIDAVLERRGLNDTALDFITLVKVISGTVQARVVKTEYSVLEDTLARRTVDQAGDYETKPFVISIKEFLRDDENNGVHVESEYYFETGEAAAQESIDTFGVAFPGQSFYHNPAAAFMPGVDYDNFLELCEAKLAIRIDPGKAYVKGYEIEKISTSVVDVDKSRTLKFRNNKTIFTPLGLFIYVGGTTTAGRTYGVPSLPDYHVIELHGSPISSAGATPNNRIGTARILNIEFFSGRNGSADAVYRLFLFDVKADPGKDLRQLKSVYSGSPTFTADCQTQAFRLTGSVSKTLSDGTPAAANTLIGIGTSWRNDETQRLFAGDYVQVGLGVDAKTYKVTSTPDSDNVLSVTPDPQADSHTWVDGATIDYLYVLANSNSADPSLVFPLADSFVYTLRGDSQDVINPLSIDTVYAVKRVVGNGVLPSGNQLLFSSLPAGEEFEDFSTTDYIVIGKQNGDWLEVIPYVAGTPGVGKAEVKPLGNQLTIYLNASDSAANSADGFYVVAGIIKSDTQAQEKAKTLIKGSFPGGFYSGTSVVSNGSEVAEISLGKADVLRITRVIQSQDFNTVPGLAEVPTGGDRDITGLYNLDNGQRDYFYDIATAFLAPGATRPTGQVRIEFDYFEHGVTGNYFSADSYPFKGGGANMSYDEIPNYKASNGANYDLASSIDFRPRVSEPGGIGAGFSTSIEMPRDNFRADYHFYQGRLDKLYLDRTGDFSIKKGVPDAEPNPPAEPATGMVIYDLRLTPYTATPADCVAKKRDNRTFTMRDIGKLKTRIENLEYYTALSLQEKNTADLVILDAQGNNKFKNGFLVDNFGSFAGCDLGSPDFKAALDTINKEFRPMIYQDAVTLFEKQLLEPSEGQRDTNRLLSNYQKTGDYLTLPYDKVLFSQQTKASKVSNVNPYAVFTYVGAIKLSPWSDSWRDVDHAEPLNVTDDGAYDAVRNSFGPLGTTIEYNQTINNWVGQNTVTTNTGRTQLLVGNEEVLKLAYPGKAKEYIKKAKQSGFITVPPGYTNSGTKVPYGGSGSAKVADEQRTTTTITGHQILTGLQNTFVDLGFSDPVSLGDKVISTAAAEFIRPNYVVFYGKGFMPGSRVYPYFDDVDVSDDCAPNVECLPEPGFEGNLLHYTNLAAFDSAKGDPLICDNRGRITGTFLIPNRDGKKFRTGDRVFRLTTSPSNAQTPPPASFGESRYTSRGWVDTKQVTTYSTRNYKIETSSVSKIGNPLEGIVTSDTLRFGNPCPRDPIAQSFFVYESGGCFITDVDVFFYKRPTDTNKPQPSITLQIRPLEDGGNPSHNVLPFGEVIKESYQVVTNKIDLVLGTLTVEGNDVDGVAGVDTGPWNGSTEVSNESGRTITDGIPVSLGTVPVNDMIPTRFVFESPIYLAPNTSYCFVLISDSNEYNVWVAQSGPDVTGREGVDTFRDAGEANTNIGTTDTINKDPYVQGVFFKSQNGISWSADQTIDIKFKIRKAEFDITENGEIEFVNAQLPIRLLTLDPLQTLNGSSLVRVLHTNHGNPVVESPPPNGQTKVILSGVSGTSNGIPLLTLNDPAGHDIVSVEQDYYIIDVGAAATSSGRIGGSAVYATENKRFEECILISTPLVLSNTDIAWNIQTTSSQGVNDSVDSAYDVMARRNIVPNERFAFDIPMQVSSWINEQNPTDTPPGPSHVLTSGMGDHKSVNVRAVLSSTDVNLSPVIDTSRLTLSVVANRIDNPHGYVPLNSDVDPASVINTAFDTFVCLPSTDAPAVNPVPTLTIHFSTSTGALTGTASNTLDSTTVTGLGTLFLSELNVGDRIKDNVTGQERTVVNIISNTSLIVNIPFSPVLSGATLYIDPPNLKIKTANANAAAHLSKLDVGKLLSISGATGDRNFTDKFITEVNYTPNNTVTDADLGAPSLCDITIDYRPIQAAGKEVLTTLNITQKDRFIDEIAPSGGSCSAKYVSKKLVLSRSSNSLKISFDANRHSSNTILVYYKLQLDNSDKEIDDTNWILAEFNLLDAGQVQAATPDANENPNEYSAYECNILDLPGFTVAQAKIVLRGGNPARTPKVKNFTMIALDE